jgi:two-component system, cell cycle response regulator DivK
MKELPLVLIVDDQPDNLYMYTHYFDTQKQLRLVTAMNGPEALVKAKRLRPDAILLDVAMPHMDGYDVARALADDPDTREIPVVLLSAYASESDARQRLGPRFESFVGRLADGYVSKPCLPEALFEHVRRVLERKDGSGARTGVRV